jgi:diguanylate cyclase (GGDEF)-like protein
MLTTELLARVPLFREIGHADLERIAAITHTESHTTGKEVVRIGDAGHSLYVVLEGTVVVVYPSRSADVELARLGAGEFFGEMAILNEKPRSATVRAVGDVKLLRLEKEDFTRAVADHPQLALAIMASLAGRIRHTDEQLSRLSDNALRDSLTGLLNRRSFHDRLAEEAERSRRYGDAFAVLLLDVDHLKRINDTFGLQVGDTVLAWVGRMLTEHTRGADVAFRVGGEEFALICPETSIEEAGAAARRLVDLIAGARPPVSFGLSVTVSAGCACCPMHGKRGDQVLQAADEALLRAKANGRNRAYGAPQPVG